MSQTAPPPPHNTPPHDTPPHHAYDVRLPAHPLPLIFDSPHSGRNYPADFDYACPAEALIPAEDNYVDALFSGVTNHGAALLCALFPRTYIDVNRAVTDIDPDLLRDEWPGGAKPTRRSHAGIGLIRRLVRPGMPVYDRRLRAAEIRHRIDHYYHPYHRALAGLIDDAHYNFGQVWHINCHSMPTPPPDFGPLADFVIGDRDGTSSGQDFTAFLHDTLTGMGYRVALNHPYKGVEILRRHGDPARGRHSIQLEISKSLYWNERTGEKTDNFNAIARSIETLSQACAAYINEQMEHALAAD